MLPAKKFTIINCYATHKSLNMVKLDFKNITATEITAFK